MSDVADPTNPQPGDKFRHKHTRDITIEVLDVGDNATWVNHSVAGRHSYYLDTIARYFEPIPEPAPEPVPPIVDGTVVLRERKLADGRFLIGSDYPSTYDTGRSITLHVYGGSTIGDDFRKVREAGRQCGYWYENEPEGEATS